MLHILHGTEEVTTLLLYHQMVNINLLEKNPYII